MRHNAPFSKIEPAGRRGQWRRGLLLAAVAVLALAASLVMNPVPAEAQSTVTLVSNLGGLTFFDTGGSHPTYASSFTTGPAGSGYGLASVTLHLGKLSDTPPALDFAIHSDSSGVPGERLFALESPSSTLFAIHDFYAFDAPSGTRLTPHTTYWVVAGSTSSTFRVYISVTDTELSGKQPGWSIGNNFASLSGPDANWVTDSIASVQMAVQGVVVDSFVSNLGSTGLGEEPVVYGELGRLASKFTTGPNRGGYRLTSVTLRLRRNEEVPQGEIRTEIKIYRDSDGLPGSEFFSLNNPQNISDMIAQYRNYKFTAPTDADTRLPPNRSYWVVVSLTTAVNNSIFWQNGDSVTEQPGWSIGNSAERIPFFVPIWEANTKALKMSVQGEVLRTSDLPTRTEWADYDLPLYGDTWGYVDTSAPSSGTLNDPLDDLQSNGDRWRLHVDSSRRYRVEVNFGSATPEDGYDEGGGIDVWDFKPRGDLWDHRSDDGRAFIEFHTSPRTPYYLLVRARSFGEHQTWEYFGDYTITLTDISHIYQMVSNGIAISPWYIPVGNTFPGNLWRATSFTTGPHSPGYKLDHMGVGLDNGVGVSSVKAALYSDSSGNPGTELFEFERISRITGAYSALYHDRFWAPSTAANLAASTTYWVVFMDENAPGGTYYSVRFADDGDENPGAAPGWSIGDKALHYDAGADSPSWVTRPGNRPIVMDIHASAVTTGSATEAVDRAAPQLQSASVDGHTLTLAYDEELDLTSSPPSSAFTVNVNGSSRPLVSVGVGQSSVLLSLSTPVEAGDTVTVDYTVPTGESEGKLQDPAGNAASSFTAQQVTNDTASSGGSGGGESGEADPPAAVPLTATAHGVPADHDGNATFSFELRFSETPEDDFSYKTLRDHAFSVTGGEVVKANRLVNGENVRWQVHVAPDGSGAATIVLPPTTDCEADGAICTEDGAMLSGRLEVTVPQQNTAATGAPTISGTAQVGETLTARTTAINDADGLDDDTFDYQWLANDGAADADISGATGSSYTLVDSDEGKSIKVRVSFTDDGGNAESLTSAATAVVTAAPSSISEDEEEEETTPLTAGAHDVPGSHDGSATFTFELRFSEQIPLSYVTLRDHAFTVTGGEVTKARRLEPGNSAGKNVRWEISVTPDGNGAVTIVLPPTTDCDAEGAICTGDGGMLSNRLEITVPGPGG